VPISALPRVPDRPATGTGDAASAVIVRAPKLEAGRGGVNFGLRLGLLSLIGAAAIALQAGCSSPSNPAPVDAGVHWPTYMGNVARTPFLSQRVNSNPPSIMWSQAVGAAMRGMPIVTDEVIIAATTDRNIHTLNRLDGSTYWRRKVHGPPVSPLVVGRVIYAGTEDRGQLITLEAVEGEDTWDFDLPSVAVPITLAGDTLFAATEDGSLFAIEPGQDEPIWQAIFPRKASAGPLVVDGWVIYVAYDSIYLIDRIKAEPRSTAYSSEIFIGEVATDGEAIYLATEVGSLVAWSLPDLEFLWQASGFGNFAAGPVLVDSIGYAINRVGKLIRFDTGDGSTEIIADARGTVLTAPVVVENGVLFGTMEGHLHFFSRNGEPIWEVELEGSIENPPFVYEGRIVLTLYGVAGSMISAGSHGKVVELR